MDTSTLQAMTVVQLKSECTKLHLQPIGKKAELIERLKNKIKADKETEDLADAEPITEENGEEDNTIKEALDVKSEQEEEVLSHPENESDVLAEAENKEQADEEIMKMETTSETAEDLPQDADDDSSTEANAESESKSGHDQMDKRVQNRNFLEPPSKYDYRKDKALDQRFRTVIIGPLTLNEMNHESLRPLMIACQNFFIRFHASEPHSVDKVGHLELRFLTMEESDEVAASFEKFKDDLEVKQLSEDVTVDCFDKSIRSSELPPKEEIECRMICAYNIPESCTIEELRPHFPGVISIMMGRNKDKEFKGHVYLEYESEEITAEKCKTLSQEEMKIESNKIEFMRIAASSATTEVLADQEREKLESYLTHLQKQINSKDTLKNDKRRLQKILQDVQNQISLDNSLRKKENLPVVTKKFTNQSSNRPRHSGPGNRGRGDGHRRGNQPPNFGGRGGYGMGGRGGGGGGMNRNWGPMGMGRGGHNMGFNDFGQHGNKRRRSDGMNNSGGGGKRKRGQNFSGNQHWGGGHQGGYGGQQNWGGNYGGYGGGYNQGYGSNYY